HGQLRFRFHPSLHLLRTGYPVDAIWRAVLAGEDEALAAIRLSAGPVWLLVHRGPAGVDVERMEADAWSFAAALFAGVPLDEAVAKAAGAQVPAALAQHLARGHIVGFEVADPMSS